MARKNIDTTTNNGSYIGDPAKTAFEKTNDNFSELYSVGYRKDNIVGTVSQSNGVPTGSAMESGSNSSGEYVRHADGTLECRIRFGPLSSVSPGNDVNPGARPWPAPFVGTVVGQVSVQSSYAAYVIANFEAGIPLSSGWSITAHNYSPVALDNIYLNIVAKGRWYQ